MKNKITAFVLSVALLVGLLPVLPVQPVQAQTTTTKTYLSSAVTSTTQNTVVVASATGISASSGTLGQRYILIDKELLEVTAVSSTTLTVRRGRGGTTASRHASGSLVVYGPPGTFDPVSTNTSGVFLASLPIEGTPCTSTSNEYTQVFDAKTGEEYQCVGSVWRSLKITPGLAGLHQIVLCGDLANNTTSYLGASDGFPAGTAQNAGLTANDLSFSLTGTGCDALDSTTEGTADTVMFAGNALRVLGMVCTVGSAGSNGITLNARASTANLTPDVSITIPTGSTTGAVWMSNSPVIAANAPIAVRNITTEDLSASNGYCTLTVQVLP